MCIVKYKVLWISLNVLVSLTLPCSQEIQVELDYVPPPKELERALASRFVMTMASSPPNQPAIRFFFYARHVRASYVTPPPPLPSPTHLPPPLSAILAIPLSTV